MSSIRSAWVSGIFGLLICATPAAFGADGSSGCGPGWYVFKQNSLVSSMLRGTTNGMLAPTVTVGMTVGTSNCAKHSIVQQEKAGLHLATMAREELLLEMAQGQGEHVSAFAHTLGCNAAIIPSVQAALQNNYDNVAPTSDVSPESLVGNAMSIIHSDENLSAQCSIGLG